jgi:hypothetical protein
VAGAMPTSMPRGVSPRSARGMLGATKAVSDAAADTDAAGDTNEDETVVLWASARRASGTSTMLSRSAADSALSTALLCRFWRLSLDDAAYNTNSQAAGAATQTAGALRARGSGSSLAASAGGYQLGGGMMLRLRGGGNWYDSHFPVSIVGGQGQLADRRGLDALLASDPGFGDVQITTPGAALRHVLATSSNGFARVMPVCSGRRQRLGWLWLLRSQPLPEPWRSRLRCTSLPVLPLNHLPRPTASV